MQGKAIHCTARSNIAHNFVGLKEGSVYSIKNFIVQPNKDEYRIKRHDPFILEFDGSTRTRKVSTKTEGFIRYPFELIDLDDIVPKNNKYLIGKCFFLYTLYWHTFLSDALMLLFSYLIGS